MTIPNHTRRPDGGVVGSPPADAPREEHEAFARNFGYFWLPCARCGRWHGGHEGNALKGGRIATVSPSSFIGTCCPDDGKPLDPLRIAYFLGARDAACGKTFLYTANGPVQSYDPWGEEKPT
jgi:hypothetical protein